MGQRTNLTDRYELKEVLGQGGMGVVYRAYDTLLQREVALKTILDVEDSTILDLFFREWSVLASMVHPNIIGIYDIGEFDHLGVRKPFFVMPLLRGVSLDRLIIEGSPRLRIEKAAEMLHQAARGLHAAHEQGLIHRDIKPSNIFVLDDDSIKIIDFGVARPLSAITNTTIKGTLLYLAPEQIQMKPPSVQSDIYALGVVAYETFTRRHPFGGSTETDLVNSILNSTPPPASELNPNVPFAVSQVIHKAMARQPWHRFKSAREFGDTLMRASRGEAIEFFDISKVRPRLERAEKSFEQGDDNFANEILAELEGEGHLMPEIGMLRRRLDERVRQSRIKQLLESARRFFNAEEYTLALKKTQEALESDPNDIGALSLKSEIEKSYRQKEIGEWISIARQHIANNAFGKAREAVENVLQVKSTDSSALNLLAEIHRKEQELSHVREEKAKLYQVAMQAWERGDVTSALSKLEALVGLSGDSPGSDAALSSTYQNLYNQVRGEHHRIKNGYEEARKLLSTDNFEDALAICRQFLVKYPTHALFQSLQFDIEQKQRQKLSSLVAETDRRVEQEPDLDRRAAILEEALQQYPAEPHFEQALKLVKDKRDLVNSIVGKARFYEERGQLNEALDQWQILRSIHEQYPGLQYEIERLTKRRELKTREEAKERWVKQIDLHLEAADFVRAQRDLEEALTEFPQDPELIALGDVLRKHIERQSQIDQLLANAHQATESGDAAKGLDLLRQAYQLEPRNPIPRSVLVRTLMEEANRSIATDLAASEDLLMKSSESSLTTRRPKVCSPRLQTGRKRTSLLSVSGRPVAYRATRIFRGRWPRSQKVWKRTLAIHGCSDSRRP